MKLTKRELETVKPRPGRAMCTCGTTKSQATVCELNQLAFDLSSSSIETAKVRAVV